MSTYFRNDELNYVPLVKATLRNPIDSRSMDAELVIDTGFQGGVLIPLRTYVSLGLNLLEEPKVTARTAVGSSTELRVSKVLVEIKGVKVLCTAYTTLGVRRALIGREVLKGIGLLYKPPHKLELGLPESDP